MKRLYLYLLADNIKRMCLTRAVNFKVTTARIYIAHVRKRQKLIYFQRFVLNFEKGNKLSKMCNLSFSCILKNSYYEISTNLPIKIL